MTTKAKVLRSVRNQCLECCCGSSSEVAKCHLYKCALHPFRFGRDPDPSRKRGFAKSHDYTGDFQQEKATDAF